MSADNAHKILTVYAYFEVQPDHDLVSSDFSPSAIATLERHGSPGRYR